MKLKNSKILILTGKSDLSSTNVMKWIHYLDNSVNIIRLNTDDLFENYSIRQEGIATPIFFSNKNADFSTDKISIVWSWKWFQPKNLTKEEISLPIHLINKIDKSIQLERNAFFQYFLHNLNYHGCMWLNRFATSEINKLEQLQAADLIGLKTPYTFLKTKLDAKDFKTSVITKPMSDGLGLAINDSFYRTYTSRVEKKHSNAIFSVSLFQEEIEKEIELRVFYLDKKCYTVAILSQADPQTAVDYRNYNYNAPSRLEYYSLPDNIEKKNCIVNGTF